MNNRPQGAKDVWLKERCCEGRAMGKVAASLSEERSWRSSHRRKKLVARKSRRRLRRVKQSSIPECG